MSRRMSILLVSVLLAAACSGESDASTATTAPSTTTTAATTTSAATDPGNPTTTTSPADSTTSTQAPTGTTTTVAGPVMTVIDIALTGGTVERVERFDVPLDGTVRLTVGGDVSDEVHLHGYDLHADVTPGQNATIEFDATIPGVFEIELEGSGVLIGELQVAP